MLAPCQKSFNALISSNACYKMAKAALLDIALPATSLLHIAMSVLKQYNVQC